MFPVVSARATMHIDALAAGTSAALRHREGGAPRPAVQAMPSTRRSAEVPVAAPLGRPLTLLLRAEGAAVLLASLAAYARLDGGWGLFALLFLAPDLTLLGYAFGARAGAAIYNAGHSYVLPALLAGAGLLFAMPAALAVALIWSAHIGFDRMLGYGLKRSAGFSATHLGPIGRTPAA